MFSFGSGYTEVKLAPTVSDRDSCTHCRPMNTMKLSSRHRFGRVTAMTLNSAGVGSTSGIDDLKKQKPNGDKVGPCMAI